jgi:hypothetical protein
MQIQLKQKEIETALKLYVSRQGIDLKGKNVTIDFTAGRKDSGLSADIVIEGKDFDPEEEATPAAEPPATKTNIFEL